MKCTCIPLVMVVEAGDSLPKPRSYAFKYYIGYFPTHQAHLCHCWSSSERILDWTGHCGTAGCYFDRPQHQFAAGQREDLGWQSLVQALPVWWWWWWWQLCLNLPRHCCWDRTFLEVERIWLKISLLKFHRREYCSQNPLFLWGGVSLMSIWTCSVSVPKAWIFPLI